jgi:hypothetical protein
MLETTFLFHNTDIYSRSNQSLHHSLLKKKGGGFIRIDTSALWDN